MHELEAESSQKQQQPQQAPATANCLNASMRDTMLSSEHLRSISQASSNFACARVFDLTSYAGRLSGWIEVFGGAVRVCF
jgi:hypothetical protein